MLIRKGIIFSLLALLFTSIILLFWYNEFVYSLPTPVPKNYVPVKFGNKIDLPAGLHLKNNHPVFLHFFNPDCPCSRFNMSHFKSLVKQYGSEVTFVIVVVNNDKYTEEQIQDKFNLNIPVYFDKSIAAICGVYSTPQAVLIDNNQKLFYRGNYNRSRYCADERTNFAQQAIDSLLHSRNIFFNQFALKAYGCQLPGCTK